MNDELHIASFIVQARPDALAAVRADFEAGRGDVVFKAYLPDGPPPVPKDGDSAR